jgi:hypothetical protein
MSAADVLLKSEDCVMLLVDYQAGLGFGVESIPRQLALNNAVGLEPLPEKGRGVGRPF